ncbi:MAG TPA: ABC transporter substrate-binding protein [Burkholderiales bacterium]|nr:ABC transporter substrate-binding protein [Burkholderiales bacterium]
MLALGAGAIVPLISFAQRQGKLRRIGFLGPAALSATAHRVEGLRAGLRELGYVEGKNIAIEFRFADGKYERLPELAAELVRLKVDLIVTHGTPATQAAQQATATIPIVIATITDPVASGVVASLRQPGKNVTGVMVFTQELNEKRLEMLRQVFPNAKRVAILANADNVSMKSLAPALEATGKALKLEVKRFDVRSPDEFEKAFSAMAAARVDAVVPIEDAMLFTNDQALADQAAKRRLPLIAWKEAAEKGGFLAYGVDFPDMFRRSASYVDRILKGARPADLPMERSTKFELLVNMKTARSLGIKLPQSVLVRADRVIE